LLKHLAILDSRCKRANIGGDHLFTHGFFAYALGHPGFAVQASKKSVVFTASVFFPMLVGKKTQKKNLLPLPLGSIL
jgi:hypothetical protein